VKKRTVVKIVLDVLMIVVIALMYSKQALGLKFHEIGGLILIGVFFIHKGLNFEWIRRVTVKLFKADGKTRLKWIVDALMLLGFLAVGVSGILISKIAFPGLSVQGGPWKAIHYSCAALSLMLVGVHLGLHFNHVKGIFSRFVRLPRVIAVVLTAVILAYGVYGLAATSFVRWLTMPFTASAQGGEGMHENRGGQFPGAESQTTDASADSTQTTGTDTTRTNVDTSTQTTGDASTQINGDASAQTTNDASTQTTGSAGQGPGQGLGGDRGGQSGSLGSALNTLAQYFSIAFLFTALTAFADRMLRRKKRQAAA
jgi:hypothetical protein